MVYYFAFSLSFKERVSLVKLIDRSIDLSIKGHNAVKILRFGFPQKDELFSRREKNFLPQANWWRENYGLESMLFISSNQ